MYGNNSPFQQPRHPFASQTRQQHINLAHAPSLKKGSGKLQAYWIFVTEKGMILFKQIHGVAFQRNFEPHKKLMGELYAMEDKAYWKQREDEENSPELCKERRDRKEQQVRHNKVNNSGYMGAVARARNLKNRRDPLPMQERYKPTTTDRLPIYRSRLDMERLRDDRRAILKQKFRLNKDGIDRVLSIPCALLSVNVYGSVSIPGTRLPRVYLPSELSVVNFTLGEGILWNTPYQTTWQIAPDANVWAIDEAEKQYYDNQTGISIDDKEGKVEAVNVWEEMMEVLGRSEVVYTMIPARDYNVIAASLYHMWSQSADGDEAPLKEMLEDLFCVEDVLAVLCDVYSGGGRMDRDELDRVDLATRRRVVDACVCGWHSEREGGARWRRDDGRSSSGSGSSSGGREREGEGGEQRYGCARAAAASVVHNLLEECGRRRVHGMHERDSGVVADMRPVKADRFDWSQFDVFPTREEEERFVPLKPPSPIVPVPDSDSDSDEEAFLRNAAERSRQRAAAMPQFAAARQRSPEQASPTTETAQPAPVFGQQPARGDMPREPDRVVLPTPIFGQRSEVVPRPMQVETRVSVSDRDVLACLRAAATQPLPLCREDILGGRRPRPIDILLQGGL